MTTGTLFFFQTEAEIKSFLEFFPIPKAQVDPVGDLSLPPGVEFQRQFKIHYFPLLFHTNPVGITGIDSLFLRILMGINLSLAGISLGNDKPSSGDDPCPRVPVPHSHFQRVPWLCWQLPAAPQREKSQIVKSH